MSDHAAPIEYYHFHWLDYIVFGTMLVFSGLSGIYFGFYRRRKAEAPVADEGGGEYIPEKVNDFGSKSMNEYLLGSRKMKAFPVAMSLIARCVENDFWFSYTTFYDGNGGFFLKLELVEYKLEMEDFVLKLVAESLWKAIKGSTLDKAPILI